MEIARPEGGSTEIFRRSLHDQLADRLRDMIVGGEIAEGQRIPERQLCERFGTSRTPLREVLKVLANEGLVDLHPFRGAVVASISEREAEQIRAVLSALEQAAAEPACLNASDAEIARIRALHAAMLQAFSTGERIPYIKLNVAIHGAIVAAACNPVLLDTYTRLNNRFLKSRYRSNEIQSDWNSSVADHERMLAAIEARDGRHLADLIRVHYAEWRGAGKAPAAVPPPARKPRRAAR